MSFDKNFLRLYAITDRRGQSVAELVKNLGIALKNGVTMVQLREKDLSFNEYAALGAEVKKITDSFNVPLIINDNAEVALACGACGVHIGQNDMSLAEARRILGKDKIIGTSARTVQQAISACFEGCDYIGAGAVFNTSTKLDAKALSHEELAKICNAASVPVVAIGGITEENILRLKGTGIAGVALVSAVFAAEDIALSCMRLHSLAGEL